MREEAIVKIPHGLQRPRIGVLSVTSSASQVPCYVMAAPRAHENERFRGFRGSIRANVFSKLPAPYKGFEELQGVHFKSQL